MARKVTAITMYRGDSYPITLTLTDKATAAAIDLTGCTLLMTVDETENPTDDSTMLFEVEGALDADPETGKATFTPLAADTATVGNYFYDIQLTDADGNIRTVVKSTFVISQDITK
jgi:hypothetical protein